jgi:hypothetical protein
MKKVSRGELMKAQRGAQTQYSVSGEEAMFGLEDDLFGDEADAAVNPLSQVFMPSIKRADYAVNPLSDYDAAVNPLSQVFMPGIKRSDYAVNPLSGDGDVFMPGIKRADYAVNPLSGDGDVYMKPLGEYDAAVNPLSGLGKMKRWHLAPGAFKGKKLGRRSHNLNASQIAQIRKGQARTSAMGDDAGSMF